MYVYMFVCACIYEIIKYNKITDIYEYNKIHVYAYIVSSPLTFPSIPLHLPLHTIPPPSISPSHTIPLPSTAYHPYT